MSKARQEILNLLKYSVHPEPEKPDFNSPIYPPLEKPLEIEFKANLEKVNGRVSLFKNEQQLFTELKSFLAAFDSQHIFTEDQKIQEQFKKYNIPIQHENTVSDLEEVGITACEFLIAHTGSIMVSSAQQGSRQSYVFPPVHIIIAKRDQIVDYLDMAYNQIQEKYKNDLPSQITLITGPSRTADIEKTLVLGAHGPKELYVFIS